MNNEQLQAENISKTIKEGIGLKYGYNTWIEAKDTKRKRVLVGGLGGMGVGRMWCEEDKDDYKRPGYNEAPEQDSAGQFGTSEWRKNIMRENDLLFKLSKNE